MWGIESLMIINLINYLIMALVFYLPVWVEHSLNISFLKYSGYQITRRLFFKETFKISWIISPSQVCICGKNDEYSFKISLHLWINPRMFYFILNQMAKSLVLFSPMWTNIYWESPLTVSSQFSLTYHWKWSAIWFLNL